MSSFLCSEACQDGLDLHFPLISNFLVDDTVEDKNEKSLERVESSEGVGEGWGRLNDGEDADTPGDAKQEDETKQTFHVHLQRRRPGLVDNERLSAVLMNLVYRHTEKVEICSHYEEDWHHEGEDKVDVVVQPTVISAGNK